MLERGEVANSWRHERWDSLRLLTPNWLNRLPGHPYRGPDPDGYMTSAEVAELIERFAGTSEAPVRTAAAVTSIRRVADGYRVVTGDGEMSCRSVVLATGACNLPAVPAYAGALPPSVRQMTPFDYRNPDSLSEGGVLVVGASATGVQIAAEVRRSGRRVLLAAGEHVRLPRLYQGRDVLWWMDATGVWDQSHDSIDDLTRARSLPSPQLIGTPDRSTLDLNTLTDLGVEVVGRVAAVRDGALLFSGGLRNVCALADLKMQRLLSGFADWAGQKPDEDLPPTRVPAAPRLRLDLGRGEIATIIWATGFRPDYRWLQVPVLDAKGRLRHEGGVVDSPGMYALGLPVLRRRRSTFLNGIEDDAHAVIGHLAASLTLRE